MTGKNIRLFRLWGIPVELNLSWLLVLALITWTFANGYYAMEFPELGLERWFLGFITAILLFISILLHEFSHSLVASRNGLPIRKITLFMFGGVAQMDREADDPVLEFKMAVAGPLMSLVLAVLFFLFSIVLQRTAFVPVVFRFLATINVMVLLFNLVPGFPLDGGRILRAAIWYKTGDVRRATKITSRIGTGFATFLMIFGLFVFIVDGNLIHGLWLVFIGFFLRQAAQSGYLMVAFKQTLGHMHVSDVMRTGVITVDTSLSLSNLVDDYFLKYHYGSFPVLKDGELVGLITLKNVKQVERSLWSETTVEDVMDDNIGGITLRSSDPAEKLLRFILRKGHGRVPVVDEYGRLVGIVTRRDLMEVINMMTLLQE